MNFSSYDVIENFEKAVAEYAGAKYGVAVESCCAALFLCLLCIKPKVISIPKFTYPGVACAIINAGAKVVFDDRDWQGVYSLDSLSKTPVIWDSAMRFKKGMFREDFYCLSFQNKKHLPIGRGGMILCNNSEAVSWFKKARLDGRDYSPKYGDGSITMVGWNMYMTPEQAARGLMLFERFKNFDLPDLENKYQNYPDLSKVGAYK